MIRNTTGPEEANFLERIEFAPVRVSAGLRRKGDEAALELAARINALLESLPERAAQLPDRTDGGPRLIHGSLMRVTPGLLRVMQEQLLRLELHRMISECLEANPEWADLRQLLW